MLMGFYPVNLAGMLKCINVSLEWLVRTTNIPFDANKMADVEEPVLGFF